MSKDQSPLWGYNPSDYPYLPELSRQEEEELVEIQSGLATEEVLQITGLDLDSIKVYTDKDFDSDAIYL
jgi:hypothetical protein